MNKNAKDKFKLNLLRVPILLPFNVRNGVMHFFFSARKLD